MTDAQIINEIGLDTLARAVEMDPETVRKWRQRGIPWQHRPAVLDVAKAKRVKAPADFLRNRAA